MELERTRASLYFAAKGTCPWTIHLAGGNPPGAALLKEPGLKTSPQMRTFKGQPTDFIGALKLTPLSAFIPNNEQTALSSPRGAFLKAGLLLNEGAEGMRLKRPNT